MQLNNNVDVDLKNIDEYLASGDATVYHVVAK